MKSTLMRCSRCEGEYNKFTKVAPMMIIKIFIQSVSDPSSSLILTARCGHTSALETIS